MLCGCAVLPPMRRLLQMSLLPLLVLLLLAAALGTVASAGVPEQQEAVPELPSAADAAKSVASTHPRPR